MNKFVDSILIFIEATIYYIMLCLGLMIETIEERRQHWQHRWTLWRIKRRNPDIQELSVLSGIDKSKVKNHD